MDGRPVRGVLSAANEADLFNQLQEVDLELINCSKISAKKGLGLGGPKVKIRDIIQFYLHLKQMQGAGIPILESLADIRDTTDNDTFRDVMAEAYRDVSEGAAFSEAMEKHPKIFNNLQVSLMASGEKSGNIEGSCIQLIKFLKWVDAMQTRVRKATRYPMILMFAVVATVVIMMAFVVPKIVAFLGELDQELPAATKALMATSDFFVNYWMWVLIVPIVSITVTVILAKSSESFAYRLDGLMLNAPFMGPLIRKINIARFTQTFGALFHSGIDILAALDASSNTISNRVLKEGLENVQNYVKSGDQLSESLNKSGQFPSMVVRMVKVGEESGNLTEVLDQVSEFYTNDVDEEVEKVISMIEPSLTLILGGMILWIAVGVFGPIYASFENLDF
ncbi:MAG: type II secretion system F family protein [Alphaproteobacteria bacterium]|nr:type II secretion system F family protein [Alphaproteobacteria bacterium]